MLVKSSRAQAPGKYDFNALYESTTATSGARIRMAPTVYNNAANYRDTIYSTCYGVNAGPGKPRANLRYNYTGLGSKPAIDGSYPNLLTKVGRFAIEPNIYHRSPKKIQEKSVQKVKGPRLGPMRQAAQLDHLGPILAHWKQLTRVVVFVLCTGLCAAQMLAMVSKFLRYETSVNMKMDTPNRLHLPAVTVCTTNT